MKLNILLVDDNDTKIDDVVSNINNQLHPITCDFKIATNYDDAIDKLRKHHFDVALIDLILPGPGGEPNLDTSQTILERVINGEFKSVPHIIGLTAYEDAEVDARDWYDECMFLLVLYKPDDDAWAKRIAAKIRYLIKAKAAAISFLYENYNFDIVILVARYETEYIPVLNTIDWASPPQSGHPLFPNMPCKIGSIKGLDENREYRVVLLCMATMGIAMTATVATQCIQVFRPRLLSMLGMCCGFREKSRHNALLGDLIIADESACWDEGKYTQDDQEGFQNRAKTLTISDTIRTAVETFVETNKDKTKKSLKKALALRANKTLTEHYEKEFRNPPKIISGRLVSGLSIVADSNKIEAILRRHPTAIGLEMETYGLYTAADKAMGAKPAVLAIKGVADFGNSAKKGENYDNAQIVASSLSYVTFRTMIDHLPIFSKVEDC